MSEQDPRDPFLRNSGAVLEAILGDSATKSVSNESPLSDADDEFLDESAAMSVPVQRSSPAGPKASDRILALLNGESPREATAPPELSTGRSDSGATLDSAEHHESSSGSGDGETPDSSQLRGFAVRGISARQVLLRLREPKIALPLCGLLALLLVFMLATNGNREHESTAPIDVVTSAAGPTTSAPVLQPNAGSAIQVRSAESHCPAGSTPGMDAFGSQPGQAWSCSRAYKVDGQVLSIDLGKNYQIESIGIVPGWDSVDADGVDLWSKYRTVSRVSYRFDDAKATMYVQKTMDQRTLVVTNIEPPVDASKVVLTVLASKGDASLNTIAISSIVITGH